MVELSILAHPGDLPFFEITVRHQLRHFAACAAIDRRVLVIDLQPNTPAEHGQLIDVAGRLVDEGLIDEVLQVDWRREVVDATMRRWFVDPNTVPSAGRGRPRHQYLHSIERAQRDLILHLDSDMLFWGSTEWVDDAVHTFATDDRVAAVVPMAGAPIATSALDWLIGRRRAVLPWPAGRLDSTDVTTRHLLLSRRRLEAVGPMVSIGDEQLETSIGRALGAAGSIGVTFVDERSRTLHPHDHNERHARHVARLVALVESGRYPYRRWGKAWDITTSGWQFLPWWAMASGHHRRTRRSTARLTDTAT